MVVKKRIEAIERKLSELESRLNTLANASTQSTALEQASSTSTEYTIDPGGQVVHEEEAIEADALTEERPR